MDLLRYCLLFLRFTFYNEMLIIYPLCGLSQRFVIMGYDTPKPLQLIHCKPLLQNQIESLQLRPNDKVLLIIPAFFPIHEIQRLCPDCIIVTLNNPTEGALDTVMKGLEKALQMSMITQEYLDTTSLISLDCDVLFQTNIIDIMENTCKFDGGLAIFEENTNKDCYSFVEIDETYKIRDIKEKSRISKNAVCGAYTFSNASMFMKYARESIFRIGKKDCGEYYMSEIIKSMILDGMNMSAVMISKENIVFLGTPEEFVDNVHLVKNENIEKKRICFDLDGTLVSFPKLPNDYSTVEPINERIKLVKKLYKSGYTIIIHTARRMRTHNGDVKKVIEDIEEVTINTLNKFSIPYHELVFGKPWAHAYIDDLAWNANTNIWKKMGILSDDSCNPRHFNEVIYDKTNGTVTKRGIGQSSINKLQGELYWYESIPYSIIEMFPKIVDISPTCDAYTMEYIDGPSISSLYVHEFLTPIQFDSLLNQLSTIHSTYISTDCDDIYKREIYKFYKNKLVERTNNTSHYLSEFLDKYEENDSIILGNIHGDPVFTNILWGKGGCKFIDMRGMINNEYTIWGDIIYDYAKIYQSLIGYDEIVHDTYVRLSYKQKLLDIFWKHINNRFENDFEKIKHNILWMTKYLLITLLSCHNDISKIEKFKSLVTEISLSKI